MTAARYFKTTERPVVVLGKLVNEVLKVDIKKHSKILDTQLEYLKNANIQFQTEVIQAGHKQTGIKDSLLASREDIERHIREKKAILDAAISECNEQEEKLRAESNRIALEIFSNQQQEQTQEFKHINDNLQSDILIQNKLQSIQDEINAKNNLCYILFFCCKPSKLLNWQSQLDTLKGKFNHTFGEHPESLRNKVAGLRTEMNAIHEQLDALDRTPPLKSKSITDLEHKLVTVEAEIVVGAELDHNQIDQDTMLQIIRIYAIINAIGIEINTIKTGETTPLLDPLEPLKQVLTKIKFELEKHLPKLYCPELNRLTARHFHDKHFLTLSTDEQTTILSGKASADLVTKLFSEERHKRNTVH